MGARRAGQDARGEDPRTPQNGTCTLRDALARHIKIMERKECSPRSIHSIRYSIEFYAADFLDRDLATSTRAEMEELHDRITERGPYVANKALRHVRTLFRTARKRHSQLDHDITLSVAWHEQHRRRKRVAWEDMPAWFDAVDKVRNPVRRDLWQFILFTGLRRDDAKTVRWDDVDLDAGTIHRPKPKGGVDRTFTVPASAFVLDLLRHRRTENRELFGDDGGWVFPTMTKRGVTHVVEVKEQGSTASPRRCS